MDFLKEIKNLHLLGSPFANRLPIFSFLIEHEPTGLFLHYNFVSVLLNDLFGIQTRGGCACAGPYAQRLLGLEPEATKKFIKYLADDTEEPNSQKIYMNCYDFKNEALKPGFCRFSFTYFMEESQIDFVLSALKFVAENGWKILPFYNFDPSTNEWKFRNFQVSIAAQFEIVRLRVFVIKNFSIFFCFLFFIFCKYLQLFFCCIINL